MPRQFPWFKMRSPKEQARFELQYKNKMFILGEELQKEKEIELMKSFITSKIRDIDIIFHLLCIKEALFQEDPEDTVIDLIWWFKSKNARDIDKNERVYFISAAKLLISMETIANFPTKEDVIANSENIYEKYPKVFKTK